MAETGVNPKKRGGGCENIETANKTKSGGQRKKNKTGRAEGTRDADTEPHIDGWWKKKTGEAIRTGAVLLFGRNQRKIKPAL